MLDDDRLKVATKFLLVLFIILPFGALSSGALTQSHKYGVLIGVMVLLGMFAPNRWFRYFVWYCALWQIVLCIKWMHHGIPQQQAQVSFHFVYFTIVFSVIYLTVVYSKLSRERFYNAICIAALVHFWVAIFQMLGYDIVMEGLAALLDIEMKLKLENLYPFGYEIKALTGLLSNNNFLACFLVSCLPFFARPKWWPFGIAIMLMVLRLLTVTATFAVFVGGIYYFRKEIISRKWLWAVFGLIVAIIIVTEQSLTIKLFSSPMPDRVRWWLWALSHMNGNLMFGLGQGAVWANDFPLHNEFVEFFYNFGIVGTVFLVGFLLSVPRQNKRLFTAFIIFSITCMGTYPMHLAHHIFLIAIILGLLEREKLNAN